MQAAKVYDASRGSTPAIYDSKYTKRYLTFKN